MEQWQKLSSVIGQSCCLIADAAYRPYPRWKEAKPLPPGVTWITLRHRSEMTLTDLLHAVTEHTGRHHILLSVWRIKPIFTDKLERFVFSMHVHKPFFLWATNCALGLKKKSHMSEKWLLLVWGWGCENIERLCLIDICKCTMPLFIQYRNCLKRDILTFVKDILRKKNPN